MANHAHKKGELTDKDIDTIISEVPMILAETKCVDGPLAAWRGYAASGGTTPLPRTRLGSRHFVWRSVTPASCPTPVEDLLCVRTLVV